MLEEILVPFLAVGLAELGDKTQIALFCLSLKTNKRLQLLLGAIFAFIIVDGIAIILGSIFKTIVPHTITKLGSGICFIVCGVLFMLRHEREHFKGNIQKPFLSGFGIVALSEMGDKTQIASGIFATRYNAYLVFIGVILVLSLLSIIAVFLGKVVLEKIDERTVPMLAGLLFIAIGLMTLIS